MNLGSLFSGIGGLDLGLARAGLGPVLWQVESDEYCRRVLARHWPNTERFDDVRTLDPQTLTPVDVICGGFPCQPVSQAGKRLGADDDRWLWPAFARTISVLRPAAVIIENVLGLLSRGLRTVLADIAALGFDAEWATLSAASLGAPHLRHRLFVVATDPDRISVREQPGWLARSIARQVETVPRLDPRGLPTSDTDCLRRLEQARCVAKKRGWVEHCGWDFDPSTRVDDGIPRGLVGARRRALGNAVVPQCAEAIGRALIGAMRRAA